MRSVWRKLTWTWRDHLLTKRHAIIVGSVVLSVLVIGTLVVSVYSLARNRSSTNTAEGSGQPESRQDIAVNHFAIKVFKKLPKEVNVLISPLSLITALGAAYLGARGNTAREMWTALGFDLANLDHEHLGDTMKETRHSLVALSSQYVLTVASKVLIRRDVVVLPTYVNVIRTFYEAILEQVDFWNNGERIVRNVNQWVVEISRGNMTGFMDTLPDRNTMMLLLSTVYFRGTWRTKFAVDRIQYRKFYSIDSTDVGEILMMTSTMDASFAYSQELNSKLLELPYEGNRLSMVLVLPDSKDGLPDLEKRLTPDNLQRAIDALRRTPSVSVAIPKFKMHHKYLLKDVMRDIGIKKAFVQGEAQFGSISPSGRVYLSDVMHKTMLNVNEEGSESSFPMKFEYAMTRVVRPILSEFTFHADHPFLFVIRDRRTGMLVFMGRVYDFS